MEKTLKVGLIVGGAGIIASVGAFAIGYAFGMRDITKFIAIQGTGDEGFVGRHVLGYGAFKKTLVPLYMKMQNQAMEEVTEEYKEYIQEQEKEEPGDEKK